MCFLYEKDYVFHKNVFKWNERKPFYFIAHPILLCHLFHLYHHYNLYHHFGLMFLCFYATDNRNILTMAFFVLFCFVMAVVLLAFERCSLFFLYFFSFHLFFSFFCSSYQKHRHLKHLQLFYGKFISIYCMPISIYVCNQLARQNLISVTVVIWLTITA